MDDLSALFADYGDIREKLSAAAPNIRIEAREAGALFLGDNFEVMRGLLQDYAAKIDLVYIDPPFNTGLDFYYSREKTSHVSRSKDAVVAYGDNMDFGEYLEFIRKRLVPIHMLLSEIGTLYLHINVRAAHYIKILLDGVFGRQNFINEITRVKSNPKNFERRAWGNVKDTILVYAKNSTRNIFNNIKEEYGEEELRKRFSKIDRFGRRYTTVPCHAPGETQNGATGARWKNLPPPPGRHWRYPPQKLEELDMAGSIEWSSANVPRIKIYADESEGKKIQDIWLNFKDPQYPVYPTEKNMDMLELIVKQSSNPNSLIMDCFCGSGAFLAAGARLGRRVMGIDKSEAAIDVASQRAELKSLPVIRLL